MYEFIFAETIDLSSVLYKWSQQANLRYFP